MFDLVYNIDFELLGFLFAVLLYIETSVCYPRSTKNNGIFRMMTLMVVVTQAFDIVSAFTITYADAVPVALNMFINSGYFMSGLFLCFMLHYYVQNAIVPSEGKSILIKTNKVVLTVVEISVALNAFGDFYFYFTPDGTYVHGPLFLLLHAASLWFVVCASAALIVNRGLLKKTQLISGFLFILLYFVAVILQTFVCPDVLIIMPAVSAMLIIAIFSLESPDYAQLQKTLRELTRTKRELEIANDKYLNLAYTDIMTGLKNRAAYNLRLDELSAPEYKNRVVIMIADINELKQLNDNLGHHAGDEAIVKTAALLRQSFGEGCTCYRIGGDEFAVIACDVTHEAFEADYRRFKNASRTGVCCRERPFSIASGYETLRCESILEAYKTADQNMYRDKQQSKNPAAPDDPQEN